jgi:hypothetical protein
MLANIQTVTISAGAITLIGSLTGSGIYSVNTEGGASADDLTTITGGTGYAIITLHPAVTGQYFTLLHNGTSILLHEQLDFVSQSVNDFITLRANSAGSVWREETRGRFP